MGSRVDGLMSLRVHGFMGSRDDEFTGSWVDELVCFVDLEVIERSREYRF